MPFVTVLPMSSEERNKTPTNQQLHNSISQLASIRLQAELLLLRLSESESGVEGVPVLAEYATDGLSNIVELTHEVQSVLAGLLAHTRVQAKGIDDA